MRFPINVKIYYQEKYIGDGKFIEEYKDGYSCNLLSNLTVLSGHYESKKETGFRYGDRNDWIRLYPNKSNKEWLKAIVKNDMKNFDFVRKETDNFEEIKL